MSGVALRHRNLCAKLQALKVLGETAPATLYVHRPLLNAAEVIEWAKAQGFATTLPADDMHVTIAFSKKALDWSTVPPLDDTVSVPASDERSVEVLGIEKDAVVLRFSSDALASRWQEFRDAGASWDWPGYKPHITISYSGRDLDIEQIAPYSGELHFGPEVFAEVDNDWKDKVDEKDWDESEHPRDDDGKFTFGGGGDEGGGGSVAGEGDKSDSGGGKIAGMPKGAKYKDEELQQAIERNAFEMHATERTGMFLDPGARYQVNIRAHPTKDTVGYKARESDKMESLYNPKLADLKTVDADNPVLARQQAVLKEGLLDHVQPLGDKDVIYRGVSAEEWAFIQSSGIIQSTGTYNIAEEEQGLTFWSPNADTAEIYADSFAPWQFKATFEKPAYVIAIKRPPPERIKDRSRFTSSTEVAVMGSIPKSDIVAAWIGEVYDHRPGQFDLNRIGTTDTYHIGSRSSPSSRLTWREFLASAKEKDWDESEHPRDEDGKFTFGGGGDDEGGGGAGVAEVPDYSAVTPEHVQHYSAATHSAHPGISSDFDLRPHQPMPTQSGIVTVQSIGMLGSQFSKHPDFENVAVTINPSTSTAKKLVRESINETGGGVRVLQDRTGNVFVWPATGAIHAQMMDALEPVETMWASDEWDFEKGKIISQNARGTERAQAWIDKGQTNARGADAASVSFVSPNVRSDLDFKGAVSELKGEQQAALMRASAQIDRDLGIKAAKETSVIGAWADGAENSVMMASGTDWDHLRVAAAMKAHLANQKSALIFQQTHGGDAVLVSYQAKGELEDIHRTLLEDGIAFHTLVPAKGGATVYVADLDGSLYDAVVKNAERHDARITFQKGRAEFIGDTSGEGTDAEQRDRGRAIYERIIKESPVGGSAEVWNRIRDHWGETPEETAVRRLRIVRARARKLLRDFDESKHPRDDHGRWTDGGGGEDESSDSSSGIDTASQGIAPNTPMSSGSHIVAITKIEWHGHPPIDAPPWRGGNEGFTNIEVLINPNRSTVEHLVRESGAVRVFHDDVRNLYAWTANDAVHQQVIEALDPTNRGTQDWVPVEQIDIWDWSDGKFRSANQHEPKQWIAAGQASAKLAGKKDARARRDWDESEHPRDEDGKFTFGGGGEESSGGDGGGGPAAAVPSDVKEAWSKLKEGGGKFGSFSFDPRGGDHGFLLPDGAAISTEGTSHDQVARDAGTTLERLLDHGTGRLQVDPTGMSLYIRHRPTEAQIATLAKRVGKNAPDYERFVVENDAQSEIVESPTPTTMREAIDTVFPPSDDTRRISDTMGGDSPINPDADMDEAQKIADKVQSDLKFNHEIVVSDQLRWDHGSGVHGEYNTRTHQLLVYPKMMEDMNHFSGTVAHEIQHHKTNVARSDPAVQKLLTEKGKAALENDIFDDESNMTEYAKEFWMSVMEAELRGSPRQDDARDLAIDETLAEMSRVQYQTGKLNGSPRWQALYNAVGKSYEKHPS